MTYNRLNSTEISGRFISSTQGCVVGSSESLPNADKYENGVVMQYLGPATADLIPNHLYRCTSDGTTYFWKDVTPVVDVEYAPDRAIGTDGNGLIIATDVTTQELGTLSDARANIQTQLDNLDAKIDDRESFLQSEIDQNYATLDDKMDHITDGLDERFDQKVDKVEGKGLSEADFTEREKYKLSSIEFGAQVNTIDEIMINNVTVQPHDRIVNLPLLEGKQYPIQQLVAGQMTEVKHNLIRPVFFAQVRDSAGNVISGSMKIDTVVVDFTPDTSAVNCTMFVICGGIDD
jgi:hypothetical protein